MLTRKQVKEALEFNELAGDTEARVLGVLLLEGFQQSQGLPVRDGKLNDDTIWRIRKLLNEIEKEK